MFSVPGSYTEDTHRVLGVRRDTSLRHCSPDGASSRCGAAEVSSHSSLQAFKVL